jgi:hypothetical protein
MFQNKNSYLLSLFVVTIFTQGCSLTKWQYESETKEVGKANYSEINPQISTTKSLSDASINASGSIRFTTYKFTNYKVFQGPQMQVISRERKAPDPVGALVTTGLTVGMNLLLEPKKTGNQVIGETRNERVVRTYIDKSKGVDTSKTEWLSEYINSIGPVVIDGLYANSIEINLTKDWYDLTPFLRESPYSGVVSIKLTCLECVNASPQQSSSHSIYTRSKVINFDLDSFRSYLKDRDKKDVIPKRKTLDDSGAISASQQKCLRLGLKFGTEDFDLCISSQKR